jgi:glycine hydroxymethyltransferase
LTPKKVIGGKPYAAVALDRTGIVCNYNAMPFDPRTPMDPSGIRMGTPCVTTRAAWVSDEMKRLAGFMDEVAKSQAPEVCDRIAAEVREMCGHFPAPGLSV